MKLPAFEECPHCGEIVAWSVNYQRGTPLERNFFCECNRDWVEVTL